MSKIVGFFAGFLVQFFVRSEHALVGLWGSCDPTTWRFDIIVPLLQKWGITWFNPQRKDWSAEKAEQFAVDERQALDTVKLHFTVIDYQTRGLVSLFELYHVILTGLPFIAVIEDLIGGTMIANQIVTEAEAELINRERRAMRDAITTLGLPVFSSIDEAKWHIPFALLFPNRYRVKDIDRAAKLLGYSWRKPMTEYRISEEPTQALGDIFTAVITAYMCQDDFTVYFPDYESWNGIDLGDSFVLVGRRFLDWQRLFTPYALKFVRSGRSHVEVYYPNM